jgi:phosphoglucosamine mutase
MSTKASYGVQNFRRDVEPQVPTRLFGTDGVRGVAGGWLSAELALTVGRASTELARDELGSGDTDEPRPQVLVIRDTRESGEMLQAAVAAGISAAGGDALLGGVLPTPAAPLLIGRYALDLGVVLSASHNPYYDNGIKLFGPDGFKLSDQDEREIEARVGDAAREASGGGVHARREEDGEAITSHRGASIGAVRALHGTEEDYLRALQTRFRELDLSGLNVLLDCANGATYRVAPEIFRRLGANVSALADRPDGRNINAGCGSTHMQGLIEAVAAADHDVGFAFDGDGDRVLAVDGSGAVVDGDELMALAATHLQRAGRLQGRGVVVTVMSNYGFHTAMQRSGIEVVTTRVGDRYVLDELRAHGFALGGEQSGHIVDLSFNRSGDGVASALLVLEALEGRPLSERHAMKKLPQRLVNVRVRDRDAFEHAAAVQDAVRAEHESLAGRGRVLVRPSGTEPLVRVMVEAPTIEEAESACQRLVALVERELG